jgi:hypothetical protein
MLNVHTFEGMSLVNAKATIQHPLADEVSIAMGDGAMCTFPFSVELAFFRNGDWVDEILPEFASHHSDGVYAHVPLHEFANFLRDWKVQ